ncbi:MAG: ABC transporter permease [Bacteroidota bacterium]
MFQNYLKIAVRNLRRQKGQTAILVAGLAMGLATCFLIAVWVDSELSYDRFHENADRIYRVTDKIWTDGSGEFCASSPIPLGPTLLMEMPHLIEQQTRMMKLRASSYLLENGADKRFNENRLFFADPGMFNMFSFQLEKGDPATALLSPNSLVLTEAAAKKYFTDGENPIGQTLRFEGDRDLKVTGIAADTPAESHFHFDALVSFSTLDNILSERQKGSFYWNPAWTYVLMKEGKQPAELEAALPGIVEKYFPEVIREGASLPIQALTDIHLKSNELVGEIEPNGHAGYVKIFGAVALFVLLIAIINFVNLSAAQAIRRMKEIGLRKTLGADRKTLVTQLLGEAVLISLIAGGLAIALVQIALPFFNDLTGKSFSFGHLGQYISWFALGSVLTGLLSGLYPALYLSSFRPALAVKGIFEKPALRSRTQQGLVVLQFTISAILIIASLVAHQQLNYMQKASLGYDRSGVLIMPVSRTEISAIGRFDDFRRELLQSPMIKGVTALEEPLGVRSNTGTYRPEGATTDRQFSRLFVRDGFLETFDIELAAGRSFSENYKADSAHVIINEAMVRHLGWESAEAALQKSMGRSRVLGVTKDFHFASLHNTIEPLVLHVPQSDGQSDFFVQFMAVKVGRQDFEPAIQLLKNTWEKRVSDRAFEYTFLDDEHAQLYQAEARLGNVALLFNGLSIFIACLGLIGLATYLLGQRTKEIGIRKVLGATTAGLVGLLSKDFLKLVVIALVVASPLAYFFMDTWLQNYAFRIDVEWWVFAWAALVSVGVAFLTVGWQSMRAALADPVESLRSE